MRKSRKMLLTFLPLVILLCGCWDFERLRNRTLVTGMAVEKRGTGYQVGVEIIQFIDDGSNGQGGSGKPDVLVTTFPRHSIEQPAHLIQTRLSGEPFYPNLHILAFGPELVKEGIAHAISHFVRDPDMRRSTQVIIAEEDATKLLKIKTKQRPFSSIYLENLVLQSEKAGRVITANIGDISRAVHEKTAILVPRVAASPTGKEAKVVGTAILHNGKMVGKLSMEETQAASYLINTISRGGVFVPCSPKNKETTSGDIVRTHASLHPEYKNGKLLIGGEVKIVSYISEYLCSDERVIGHAAMESVRSLFEKKMNQDINSHISAVLHRTGADILKLQRKLEKKPEQWEQIKKNFPDLLRQADVRINVKMELKLKGTKV